MTKKILFNFVFLFFCVSPTWAQDIPQDWRDEEFESEERGLYDIPYRWDGQHKDADRWVTHTSSAIEEHDLLEIKTPGDITQFCSNFKNLNLSQKKLFWIYVVSAMTELESGFRPTTSYKESFADSSGAKVVSRGLLQLSFESARAYTCPIAKGTDLFEAKTNLNCGVKILAHWLKRDGRLAGKSGSTWLGAGRYWSIFRHKHTTLKKWTQSISFCK